MEAALSNLYIKGFNNGYFLAEHNPPLIEKLVQTETNLEYIQALRDGKKTFELEKQKVRIKEIKNLRKGKSLDREA
jgi:hypothetical protein